MFTKLPPPSPQCLPFHAYMFKTLRTSPVKIIGPTTKAFLHGLIFTFGNCEQDDLLEILA